MERERRDVTEEILQITLDIICLLTSQDYTIVKKETSDLRTSTNHPRLLSSLSTRQTPITERPPPSLIHERHNDQKILELTNKILHLLTGEVPIRCQDVAVYFSMEEWEYIDGHQDLYKDVMMEGPLALASEDKLSNMNNAERFPHPHHCTAENDDIQQDYQIRDLINVKVEDVEEDPGLEMSADPRCKEEMESHSSPHSLEENLLFSICKIEDDAVSHCLPESSAPHHIHPELHSEEISSHLQGYCLEKSPAPIRGGYNTHPCPECTKSFTQNADLIRHRRVHTGERPFMCSECGKFFKQKTAFVHHLRTHTGEKPFSCSECGKCFAYKSVLVDHQKIHTGVKPFRCNECDKSFTRKSDLNRHRRIHTGEKPFSCSKCRKRFNQKANLTIHQKVHFEKKRKRTKETR